MKPTFPLRVFPFLLHFIGKQPRTFLVLALAHLSWAADWTLMPYLFKHFIDTAVRFSDRHAEAWEILLVPMLWVCGTWAFLESLYRVADYVASHVYPKFEANLRLHMFDYIRQHSHRYFAEQLSGDLASKIEDMPEAATDIMQKLLSLFIPSFVAVLIATSMFAALHPLFGAVVFCWFFSHIGICLLSAKRCNAASDAHSESKSVINGQIVDCFGNMAVIRSFARAKWEQRRMVGFQRDEQQKHRQMLKLVFGVRVILGIVCCVMMGVVMMTLMILQWKNGDITVGELSYIFYAGWGICVMAWVSGMELPNFFKEIGKCRQALRPMEVAHEIVDSQDAVPLTVSHGEIRFEQVTFGYQPEHPLFIHRSVIIAGGSKVGLVGFSGSGKTTFVNLILRFFDLQSGHIRIDGQDIATVTQESLHQQIALIPQDISLFHRSLRENIRYGNVEASDAEVLEVAKKACCHEFIQHLPEQYDTLVGERGTKLSGGQRQRIAIARALLKKAPILILDEATSALDSVTEQHIQQGLYTSISDCTMIVIAHRLSTLSAVDRILVFDKGRIIEDGTHTELLYQNGHYARLWNLQANGFLPEKEEAAL